MWTVLNQMADNSLLLMGVFADMPAASALKRKMGAEFYVRRIPLWETFPVFLEVPSPNVFVFLSREGLEQRLNDLSDQALQAVNGINGPAPVDIYTFPNDWEAPHEHWMPEGDHAHVDRAFLELFHEEGNGEFAFGPLP